MKLTSCFRRTIFPIGNIVCGGDRFWGELGMSVGQPLRGGGFRLSVWAVTSLMSVATFVGVLVIGGGRRESK